MFQQETMSIPCAVAASAAVTDLPATTRAKNAVPSTTLRRLRPTSREAYDKDVVLFTRFGGTIPTDPTGLLRYVEAIRHRISPATAYRRLMSINRAHLDAGHPSPNAYPAVRELLRTLQSGRFPAKAGTKGAKSGSGAGTAKRVPESAKPLTRQLLLKLLDAIHRSMLDRRDKALLVLGFMCGLKRSTLVALDVQDCQFGPDALLVTIRGDVSFGGETPDRVLAVPNTGGELDAGLAVKQYIDHLALQPDTPLFRSYSRAGEPTEHRLSAAFVSEIVKRRAEAVGLDPKPFSGESLRRGRALEIAKGLL